MKPLLLLGAALVFAGPAPETRIEITARGFSPMIVEVNAGRTVVWTNADSADHTVTEASERPQFDSGRLPPGATFAHTFVRPGRYAYRSTLDASKAGRIIVQPAP
jgi:plastocyanin